MLRYNAIYLLERAVFYDKKFESITQFKTELIDYINYYNNERIKLRLKGKSPIQYRIDFERVE